MGDVVKNIREVKSQSLRWVQTAYRPMRSELRDGEDVVAILARDPDENHIEGTTAEGTWVFEEGGTIPLFLPPRLSVYWQPTGDVVASMKQNWRYEGELKIGSRSYRWVRLDWFNTEWEFRAPDGKRLVHFKVDSNEAIAVHITWNSAVETARPAGEIEDISVLTLAGWYLIWYCLMRR